MYIAQRIYKSNQVQDKNGNQVTKSNGKSNQVVLNCRSSKKAQEIGTCIKPQITAPPASCRTAGGSLFFYYYEPAPTHNRRTGLIAQSKRDGI